MTCEEMIEELLAVKKPDARLLRFIKGVNPKKQEDGTYDSVRRFGKLPIVEHIDGERWNRILSEWVEYVRNNE